MALAGINQDVWSHTVRHIDPALKHSIEPHKNGLLWRPSSLYLGRQLPFKLLISSWALNSVSVEFVPHLFLCPVQVCIGEQHTASVPQVLSGKWQGTPEYAIRCTNKQVITAYWKFLKGWRWHLCNLTKLEIMLSILSQLFRRPLSWHLLDTFRSEVSFPGQLVKYSLHQTYFLMPFFGEQLENRPFFSGWFGIKVIMLYFKL